MTTPKFLIIGTMKGGTTILYDFISEHSMVKAATQKEVHYFSLNYSKGAAWYAEHFEHVEDTFITGEASPTYFDMDSGGVIANLIKRDFPDIKLILVVRDPVERAISHYNHYCGVNKIEYLREMGAERFFNMSYSDALKCSTESQTHLHHVLSFSCYSNRYKHYKSIFGKNLLVVKNNDLRSQAHETMETVQAHLGLNVEDSDLFDQVRYSAGTTIQQVSEETLKKLQNYLYPDYKKFCELAGLSSETFEDA